MSLKGKKILVTGAAGFIGFHLTRRLIEEGAEILAIDSLNDYYDVSLKQARVEELRKKARFDFRTLDITSDEFVQAWINFSPDLVYHLAAQAGVRYSLTHPEKYIQSNLVGFFRVLEAAQKCKPQHLIYASSSSVYGNSQELPFSVNAKADQPVSIYAATKRSNELMAHSYSHLFQIPTTGLRFFTVYGSWGRPDMAYFSFTKAILEQKPIQLFAPEKQRRDFTHISDIVESMVRLAEKPPQKSDSFYRLLNIGASQPTPLLDFVKTLETTLGHVAQVQICPAQPGDVTTTYADVSALETLTGYKPQMPLQKGLEEFVQWYKNYYR